MIINLQNTEYLINLTNGEVRTARGTICKVDIGDDGAKVMLNWISGKRYYDLGVVMYAASCVMQHPNHALLALRSYRIDRDYSNNAWTNVYVGFSSPAEDVALVGYYYIPYYPNYSVNKQGSVYSYRAGRVLAYGITKPSLTDKKNRKMGYYITTAVKYDGKRTNLARHRAMLLAFKPYHDRPDRLVCNHINGIPGDDRLENIEWCTRRENNIHALKNGLCPNSLRPITYINTLTGVTREYSSIAEAAADLNVSHGLISHRMEKPDKLARDGIYFYDTGKDVSIPTQVVRMGVRIPVVSVEVATDNRTEYPTMMDAAAATRVAAPTVADICYGRRKTPSNGYLFMFKYSYL